MLIESAKTGDDEMVKIILENEEVDVNIEDDYGYTALCYAALKGNNWTIHKRRQQVFAILDSYHKSILSVNISCHLLD